MFVSYIQFVILLTGIFPNCLKLARVTLIHTAAAHQKAAIQPMLATIYPISVLANVRKIFEKVCTDCRVRGLAFKSPCSILTSRTETSSLSRVVRDGWDTCSVPVKVKSSMAKSFPVENLLPQNVDSIINYLQ